MINEMTTVQRLINVIRVFIQPRMPRWLATWGFNHVLNKCTETGDWANGMTVAELYDRWTLSKYK